MNKDMDWLVTEQMNENTADIDNMEIEDIVACMNNEDKKIAIAVEKVLPDISEAVRLVVSSLKRGGRLIYIGSGTSGRLGVLDASECPPTFNTDPELVKGIIAGGDIALRNAVEGVEDSEEQAVNALKEISITDRDIVVGITASGSTPFVLGGIGYARTIGAGTVGISCNPGADLSRVCDVMIEVIVGPEVISGSTRLKAGTAQKMVLNMISTVTMIQLGKTYRNLMVDLQASNKKLKKRAARILKNVTTVKDESEAVSILERNGWCMKEAIISQKAGLSVETARVYLQRADGNVKNAIELALKEGPKEEGHMDGSFAGDQKP